MPFYIFLRTSLLLLQWRIILFLTLFSFSTCCHSLFCNIFFSFHEGSHRNQRATLFWFPSFLSDVSYSFAQSLTFRVWMLENTRYIFSFCILLGDFVLSHSLKTINKLLTSKFIWLALIALSCSRVINSAWQSTKSICLSSIPVL